MLMFYIFMIVVFALINSCVAGYLYTNGWYHEDKKRNIPGRSTETVKEINGEVVIWTTVAMIVLSIIWPFTLFVSLITVPTYGTFTLSKKFFGRKK